MITVNNLILTFLSPAGKPAQENRRSIESGEDGVLPAAGGSPVRTSAVQTCLAELSMEIEGDFSACEDVGRAAGRDSGLSGEDPVPEAVAWRGAAQGPGFDEDLQAAVDFFRRPPPLLSPVPSPPPVSPPRLGGSPSLLAPVSGHFVWASPGGHLVHPDM